MRVKMYKSQQNKEIDFWECPDFDVEKQLTENWLKILFSKCKVADCDPHKENQNCSYRETLFR